MDITVSALVALNIAVGFSLAPLVSSVFAQVSTSSGSAFRNGILFIGIYAAESIALIIGMGMPLFSIGLAFVWGIIFRRRLKKDLSRQEAIKFSFWLSLYSSMPLVSFIIVPIIALIRGWHILDSIQGAHFGIPGFLPWPMDTIFGFFTGVIIIAFTLKVLITMYELRVIVFSKNKSNRNHVC